METENIQFEIKKLPEKRISDFFKEHDNDYFERLSDRIDIDDYSQKIYQNATHFTLYDGDTLIGFSPCYFNDDAKEKAYISSLTITDGYRRSKLGSTLLSQIKTYAVDQGVKQLIVSVHSNNKNSINFYNQNEFSVDENNEETQSCSLQYTNNKAN